MDGIQVDKAMVEASSPSLYLLSHIEVQDVKSVTVWSEAGKENPGGLPAEYRTKVENFRCRSFAVVCGKEVEQSHLLFLSVLDYISDNCYILTHAAVQLSLVQTLCGFSQRSANILSERQLP